MAGVVGPITREDAEDIAGMMVAMKRVVPPERWVDFLIDQAEAAAMDSIF
jgi:hypothetical protein